MPSRSHLTRPKPRNAIVDLGEGDLLNITFDANKITPAWMREAQQRDEAQDSYSLPKALADVMLGWDVTEDDGSEFLPTADNIGVFSYPVQSELLSKILKAAVPSDAEGEVSGALSSVSPQAGSTDSMQQPLERAPTHLNGPSPSELPAPSGSPS